MGEQVWLLSPFFSSFHPTLYLTLGSLRALAPVLSDEREKTIFTPFPTLMALGFYLSSALSVWKTIGFKEASQTPMGISSRQIICHPLQMIFFKYLSNIYFAWRQSWLQHDKGPFHECGGSEHGTWGHQQQISNLFQGCVRHPLYDLLLWPPVHLVIPLCF